MFRLTLQLRHYARNLKTNVKSERNINPIKRVPIFNLLEHDVKAQVRSAKRLPSTTKSKTKTNSIPLITCARSEFNLNADKFVPSDAKYLTIPLASFGWQHYKSKNDFFIIHPSEMNFNASNEVATDAEKFSKFDLDPILVENLASQLNIRQTTYIQQKAIPSITSGVHTLIAAETGCGKTVAYLIPIIANILKQKQSENNNEIGPLNSPRAIILTPGRELGNNF